MRKVEKKTVGKPEAKKKKRGRKPKPLPLPEITFTEDELDAIVKYMNFMMSKTEGRILLRDQKEFDIVTKGLIRHLKKCEAHILEVKRVINTRQALEGGD